ncbi:10011_t:CDS:10 [Entrophospora sp. SA101]|nr:10011_t:CDS:10 [Entrophospora sp. SA101]CAJ0840753.1 2396_t:CDS:10 [Entrophospora sp. SA101]
MSQLKMNNDAELIQSYIDRIKVNLPTKYRKLETIETDPIVQATVTAIVNMSTLRLGTIASSLTKLLESVTEDLESSNVLIDFVAPEKLQMQLFLLKILSACMSNHWKNHKIHRESQKEIINESGGGETTISTAIPNSQNHQNNVNSSPESKNPKNRQSDNPPPLKPELANFILHILSRFLRQKSLQDDNAGVQTLPSGGLPPSNQQSPSTHELLNEIYKIAGHVIFYISASNWNVVFKRIRNKINQISATNDEFPDTSELRLLECSDFNKERLEEILNVVCIFFPRLRKVAQLDTAKFLRYAIWSWIEVFPDEFVLLCQSKSRMGGKPDVLFDNCYNSADQPHRKLVLWPLQTVLLIICPDILNKIANKTYDKDSPKRSLRNNNKLPEVAAKCYVDFCNASVYLAKSDSSVFTPFLTDIREDLQKKLFDPVRPFPSEQNIDQRLMSDCLLALFRLNPQQTLGSLVKICLQDDAPIAFKSVLVKSCYGIALEEKSTSPLPWVPQIRTMYSILAKPLRKLFIDMIYKRDTRPTESGGRRWTRSEIIINILKLYKTDPILAIAVNDSDGHVRENQKMIFAISECMNSDVHTIKATSSEALLALHNVELIEKWGIINNDMQQFWQISSHITHSMAKQLLECNENEECTRSMLERLLKLLTSRNEFLKKHQDKSSLKSYAQDRLSSNIALEIALLVLLCSSDIDICTMAINCFSQLCQEANLSGAILSHDIEEANDIIPYHMTIVENMNVYNELSETADMFHGKVAQQRRIRKLLRMMTKPTPGNLGAWEEAWRRWRQSITQFSRTPDDQFIESPDRIRRFIGRGRATIPIPHKLPVSHSSSFSIPDNQLTEWQNYTGFLTSLGGCCVDDKILNSANEYVDNRLSMPQPTDYHTMVEKFIHEMVDLLTNERVFIGEIIRETLGNELSPRLFVILFRYLETLVKDFFSNGQVISSPKNTVMVEQSIIVLKLILDRIHDSSEHFYTCDLGNLVLSFARYLNSLGTNNIALRIKRKICVLTETLMIKKEFVSLRQEIKLRNNLLEMIIEWTSDFSTNENSIGLENTVNKNEKMHRELDQACLKTIVALLDKLPLQPSDTNLNTDLARSKSRLFYKYFSFFIKLLNRCRILEAIDLGTHSAKNNHDLQMLLSKSRDFVKDLGPLKDYTILALSNLLSANVDSGLTFSLSMAYHEDSKTRTAFMQVLTNILNQGVEFEGLTENAMKERYERLVNVFTGPDLDFALSLCEVCPVIEQENLAEVLVLAFDSRNNLLPLLKAMFDKEVSRTFNDYDLLRRNSIATRMLGSFADIYGDEYLRETLQPVFNMLLRKPKNFRCEIDRERMTTDDNIVKNLNNLKEVAQSFLDAIFASSSTIPKMFKSVCYHLSKSVGAKFPDSSQTTVGSFLFLRFFNPGIVAPDTKNLCKPITEERIKRILLLATKVIQNLANNKRFGAKEPYMVDMNKFLESNIERFNEFLREISQKEYSIEELRENDVLPRRLDDAHKKILHKLLYDNQERMSRDLQTRRVKNNLQTTDSEQAQKNKREWDRISTLLAQLDPPNINSNKEFKRYNAIYYQSNNHLYAEFMKRYENRNLEPIATKKLFYRGGVSKERRPVFYYIARRVDAEAIDIELLMYYVLHIIANCMNRPFEILFDLTQFGLSNEIQSQWVQQFIQILPSDVIENLATLYFYNTNSPFKKFCKKLAYPITNKLARKIVFCCSLNDLHEYILPTEVQLPSTTTQLDTDHCTSFNHVSRISHYRMQVNCTMKVSNEHIQVITNRKQDLFNGLSCYLNDVYHISVIEDVSNLSHRYDDSEFVIKQNNGRPSLAFSSSRREQIMQAIRTSKAGFQIARPSPNAERTITPNSVPGTFLNMALLNIGSEDPNLRLTSYNLLVALSLAFNFDVGNHLLSAKGLCIPVNNTNFVVQLSQRLAINEARLTLEFLTEFFVGFNKSSIPQKHLCLLYMAPWLQNLALYVVNGPDNQQFILKAKEIIRSLIDLTAKETELYTAIQTKIWSTLIGIDELTSLIIDEFIAYAVEHGIGSIQSETVANTIVTLSSISVRGKIISRLRRVISKTSLQPSRDLKDNPSWTDISVLIRFNLMLSFNNLQHISVHLPELFHIVSLLVSTGSQLIRASIHGLIVNLVQSLCTTPSSDSDNNENRKFLKLLLTELSEPKHRFFFGLTNSPGNGAFDISTKSTDNLSDNLPLNSLENVIQTLLEVMKYGAPSIDVANSWRARWMGLITSTAFQYNPAIQPRAFVALGCLAHEEVDDDLLYQILVALKGALNQFDQEDCLLVISILMCLTNIVKNLPIESRYLQKMFWLAMALIQIGHVPIFQSALGLLHSVLYSLDSKGFFIHEGFDKVLMRSRRSLESVTERLDEISGVNYEHFSFAVAATLLRCLKNGATRVATQNVLISFLEIASKTGVHNNKTTIRSNLLGYMAALLPLSANNVDMKELLLLSGANDIEIDNSEPTFKIFEKIDIPDNQTALLLVSLMVAMLSYAEQETEKLFLYGFLAEAAEIVPEVFALVYETLLPRMINIVSDEEISPIIIDSVQAIIITAISEPEYKKKLKGTQLYYLNEIGFKSLSDNAIKGDLSQSKIRKNLELTCQLIESITRIN